MLTKYKCKLGVFARGLYPSPEIETTTKLKSILMRFDLKRIDKIIKNKLLFLAKKYKWIKTYDVVFLTGEKSIGAIGVGFQYDHAEALLVEVNSADYDNYLQSSNKVINKKPYAVFLDENLPYHQDTKLLRIKTIKDYDYFPELNTFFKMIESTFKLKIKIAAHPKAVGYNKTNPFNEREIIFNKTNEMIANSKFVIVHNSTSVGYAVLHKKPILFITGLKFKTALPIHHAYVLAFNKFLNTCLINYDQFEKDKIQLKVDQQRYSDYKFSFLTNVKTEKLLTRSIFLDSLKLI